MAAPVTAVLWRGIVSVQALCQICEAAPADHQCRRCGALVCSTHYDESTGLCTECAGDAADRTP